MPVARQNADGSPRRSIWLTLFLLLQIILSLMDVQFVSMFVVDIPWFGYAIPHSAPTPIWGAWLWLTIVVAQLLSLLAVWSWSKAGVLAFAALAVIENAAHFYHSGKTSGLDLVGTAILVALVYPYWRQMHWGLVRPSRSNTASGPVLPPPLP
jgi:hypothetical protein